MSGNCWRNNHGGLFFVVLLCVFAGAFSELPLKQYSPGNEGSLRILVVGDWGREGEYNQSLVAAQMGKIGEQLDIDFVISAGDNFYEDGLTGVHDQAFEKSFSKIYTSKSLQKPWYTVLGNHDYRGDALSQLSPVLNRRDNRWICLKSYILCAEFADFFMVDTTPFHGNYWKVPNEHKYDWRGVAPRENYIKSLLKDLNSALAKSSAKWKIVVGHHAIRSVGDHGDTEELVELLLPILKANKVDLYINGHDHCLERITSTGSPIQFLTSGGGSKAWRGINKSANMDGLEFYYDGQGFMSLELTRSKAGIVFYDVNGEKLHTWNKTKHLHSDL